MQVEQLSTSSGQQVAGPLLITRQVFGDARGFFFLLTHKPPRPQGRGGLWVNKLALYPST